MHDAPPLEILHAFHRVALPRVPGQVLREPLVGEQPHDPRTGYRSAALGEGEQVASKALPLATFGNGDAPNEEVVLLRVEDQDCVEPALAVDDPDLHRLEEAAEIGIDRHGPAP